MSLRAVTPNACCVKGDLSKLEKKLPQTKTYKEAEKAKALADGTLVEQVFRVRCGVVELKMTLGAKLLAKSLRDGVVTRKMSTATPAPPKGAKPAGGKGPAPRKVGGK